MTRKTLEQLIHIPDCPEWESFLNESTNLNISFYPAAGSDYRPFLYFKKEVVNRYLSERLLNFKYELRDYLEPDLFIFSDYDYGVPTPFKNGEVLFSDAHTLIEIVSSCELKQKEGMPKFNSQYINDLASNFNRGRAFFFKAKITSDGIRRKETISYTQHALYFIYENIYLIDNFFLNNNVPITHLVWKNEGLNLGVGKIKHSFLLPLSEIFRTKYFYIDGNSENSNILTISNDLSQFSIPEIKRHQPIKLCQFTLCKKFTVLPAEHCLNFYYRINN